MGHRSRKIVHAIDGWGDRIFTPKYNPFYWLGTICFFLMALIFITGIYLFLFYRTSNPYGSLQNLSVNQWYLGGIIRSIHRYASDGLILFLILHMIREFLLGRYIKWRRFSWISGNVLLITSIFIGIMGYFLIWDDRAQLIALKTAQILDDIPIFIEPPPRTFLSSATMSKMLFFVILLGHMALPFIFISILIFMHVSRNARATVKPPKLMALTILILLLALSLIFPATNSEPADLSKLPVNVPLDWFYFLIFPLFSLFPRWAFWAISIGGVLLLFATPWLNRTKKPPVIEINPERCVGCEQCNKDCPYESIRMISRQDGRPYLLQSKLFPNRCAGCGICVASCESRAINLSGRTLEQILNEVTDLLNFPQRENGEPRILGLICEKSVKLDEIIDFEKKTLKDMSNVPVISFTCAGMIHHSIIEHALKSGADGVFVIGCQMEECYYREGARWTRERMAGERSPVFRALNGSESKYSRIRSYWLTPRKTKDLLKDVGLFNQELKRVSDIKSYHLIEPGAKNEMVFTKAFAFFAIPFLLLPAFLIFFLSTKPTFPFYSKDNALIKFTFKNSGKQLECRELTEKETETKLKHMRKTQSPFPQIRMDCERKRLPSYVELDIDNKNILTNTYYPTGLRQDGSTFAYEEIPISPGVHEIRARMRDSEEGKPFDHVFAEKIDLKAGHTTIIEFDRETGFFYVLMEDGSMKGE
jgi:coenzyme F420-reducing hydrogenase delta subunit/NAD-dependent dihydropyrimidine dehydrogenase PreA subunit